MTKNIKAVRRDLQALLDDVGVGEFPRAKSLYLKEVEIVDSEGLPIDPEEIDVEIALKIHEDPNEEHEDLEDKAEHPLDDDEEDEDENNKAKTHKIALAKSSNLDRIVNKAVKSALKNNTVRGKAFDMRLDNAREGMVRWGSLKHINRTDAKDPELQAYRFGRWAAACMGHKKSQDYCSNQGIVIKAHLESVNSQGGYLVPEEFSDTLISLREEYGVFRRNAKIEPMNTDVKRIPKRSSTMTAAFAGEATSVSETTQVFEQVTLIAKKLMVLTTISNELNEDSLINLGDSIAGEIAYAFALKEDQCGFIGKGGSTHGGILGVLLALDGVSSNAGINTMATGAAKDEPGDVALADIHATMGKLPAYADSPNAKFYMHKTLFSGIFERLVYGVGGVTAREMGEGAQGTRLFGYPVEYVQVMPSSSTADGDSTAPLNMPFIFGDLAMACSFGDRRDNTIAFSDSALNTFEQDEIAVRGTERFDAVCHSPGTSSDAGPVVALKLGPTS